MKDKQNQLNESQDFFIYLFILVKYIIKQHGRPEKCMLLYPTNGADQGTCLVEEDWAAESTRTEYVVILAAHVHAGLILGEILCIKKSC